MGQHPGTDKITHTSFRSLSATSFPSSITLFYSTHLSSPPLNPSPIACLHFSPVDMNMTFKTESKYIFLSFQV